MEKNTFKNSLGQFVRQKSAFKVVFTKKNYKLRALNRHKAHTKTLLWNLSAYCIYS